MLLWTLWNCIFWNRTYFVRTFYVAPSLSLGRSFLVEPAHDVGHDAEPPPLVAVEGARPDGIRADPGLAFATSRTMAPAAAKLRPGRGLRRRQRHHERLRRLNHDGQVRHCLQNKVPSDINAMVGGSTYPG